MKITLITKEFENNPIMPYDKLVGLINQEVKKRGFRSEDSLEMFLDSLMLDVAMSTGAYLEINGETYCFDYTNVIK